MYSFVVFDQEGDDATPIASVPVSEEALLLSDYCKYLIGSEQNDFVSSRIIPLYCHDPIAVTKLVEWMEWHRNRPCKLNDPSQQLKYGKCWKSVVDVYDLEFLQSLYVPENGAMEDFIPNFIRLVTELDVMSLTILLSVFFLYQVAKCSRTRRAIRPSKHKSGNSKKVKFCEDTTVLSYRTEWTEGDPNSGIIGCTTQSLKNEATRPVNFSRRTRAEQDRADALVAAGLSW